MVKKKNESIEDLESEEEMEQEEDFNISDHESDNEMVEYKEDDNKKRSLEEIYQKKTPLEHVLLRPDTYVGSIEKTEVDSWVYDEDFKTFRQKKISYVPALYKIFDEILVNAADNKIRDDTMNTVKVTIDRENNEISVWNNGKGIPIELHKEENIMIPTLIFGHLLTGSNFDDNIKKVTGGRNGYGAKLCNIFSEKFTVETVNSETKKKFVQTWKNNMSVAGEAKVEKLSRQPKEDYTQITFRPDFKRFGMDALDQDIIDLISKRVVDLSGTTSEDVKVFLNGKKIPVKSFKDYIKLYTGDKKIAYCEANERWKIGICVSDGTAQQVSFVNSICTTRGGKHVSHVLDPVVKHLMEKLKTKNKAGVALKPQLVKNNIFVFVNSLIINPAFDSQTKDTLTTNITNFGSKCKITEEFMKEVNKCGIGDAILESASNKTEDALKKKSGKKMKRLTGIEKLDDANDAGGPKSSQCSLILTEGDSAKALAISGLSVIGRDKYGVFPLKGKLLNVRDATTQAMMKNAEIDAITKIIGLKHGVTYTSDNLKDLRYGCIMIMADQDQDGSHIKGLVLNFIHRYWPSLLKIPGFLKEFITPIIKATHKKTKTKKEVFFNMPEYQQWMEKIGDDIKQYHVKYYKGLGTSTAAEAKEYFSDLKTHQLKFKYEEKTDESIDLAFSKKKIEGRKEWLNSFVEGTYLDTKGGGNISISDFVNKELILFSRYDLRRSIPSMVDGLKIGQRKILFGCFKRKLKNEIKVSQLAGYVSEHSAYHHGEQSLNGTIVKMAQNYVGSNNINILFPSGQFGTRLEGGKDAASARYIFTTLCQITRSLFHTADDAVLEYLDEDGLSIEPKYYIPVIPMVLVNGAEGIGTGWSTSIPCYNPRDIIENVKNSIKGEELLDMIPWYRGFKGDIEYSKSGTYKTLGKYEKIDDNTLWITELPIGEWIQDYKVKLEKMLVAGKLEEFKEHHTDVDVSFTLIFTDEQMSKLETEGIVKELKLFSWVHFSNMTLFDSNEMIKTYATPQEIIKDFCVVRKETYIARKKHLMKILQLDFDILDNKVRFILEVVENTLVIKKRKKSDLLKELKQKKYTPFPTQSKKKSEEEEGEEGAEKEEEESTDESAYNYLLKMPLWSLTLERVEQMKKKKEEKLSELKTLEATTEDELWLKDLEELEVQLDKFEEDFEKEQKNQKGAKKPVAAKVTAKKKVVAKKEEVVDVEDSPKKTTAKKETAAKKTTAKKEPAPKKEPAAKKTPAAKKEPAKKASPKETAASKKRARDEEPSLLDTLSSKMGIDLDDILPDSKKKKTFKDDSFHSLSETEDEKPKTKAAPKKRVLKPAAKKSEQTKITAYTSPKVIIEDAPKQEEEKKTAIRSRAHLKKPSVVEIDSEEEKEDEEIIVPATRQTRQKKPVAKIVEEESFIESEEEEEEFSEYDEED